MAQNDFGTINPNTKSGTDLASDLNDFRDAQNTNHNGSTQPSYVQTWMTWLDSTAANGVMKIYDGTDDVPVYVVDATNNVARVALDNDEDTYIVSSTDDTMTFVSSASTRMTLNASLLTMAVDIDMNGQNVRFDDATGIRDANNNEVMVFQTVTSAVNYFDFSPSATGSDLILAAAGDDTNIDLAITPKGSGSLVLDGLSWPNADGSADQVIKTDGSGNLSFADGGGDGWTYLSDQATTSGSAVTFTGIPAGVTEICLFLNGVRGTGTTRNLAVTLGDSGGLETSGYFTNAARYNSSFTYQATSYRNDRFEVFGANIGSASYFVYGNVTFKKSNDDSWNISGNTFVGGTEFCHLWGRKNALTTDITQLSFFITDSQSFDAGSVSLMYRS